MKIDEFAYRIEVAHDRLAGLRQQVKQLSLSPEIILQQVFFKLNQALEDIKSVQKQLQSDRDFPTLPEPLEINVDERLHQLRDTNQQLLGEIVERKRAESLLKAQTQVLEKIATGASLTETLNCLAKTIEQQSSGLLCSILLIDRNGSKLRYGAAPSLPDSYNDQMDGVAIAPGMTPCGTAAYLSEPAIVSDIATDPLGTDFKQLGLSHGLRSCWSAPIIANNGNVLGTFAMYYRKPRSPNSHEWQTLKVAVHLAAIAIEKNQAEELSNERSHLSALISKIGLALQQNHELPEILQQCRSVLTQHLDLPLVQIWTFNSSNEALELATPTDDSPVNRLKIDCIAQTAQPYLTHNLLSDRSFDRDWVQREEIVLFAGYPLIVEAKVIGVLAVFARDVLSQNVLNKLTTIADSLAQCIERKRTETALQNALKRLDLHFENTPAAVIEWDSHFQVSRWSQQAEKIFGWKAEEVFGLRPDCWPFILAEDLEKIYPGMEQLSQSNPDAPIIHSRNYRKDGTIIDCDWYNSIVLDEAGNLVSVLSFIVDVTERNQMQKEIERSLSLLSATLEATGEGIIASREGKYIATVNQKFLKMWGIPESAIASRELQSALPYLLERVQDPEAFVAIAQSLFSQPDAEGYDIFHLKDNRVIERYSRPQRLGSQIMGRVCCFRDITERCQAEEALRLGEERFQILSKATKDVIWDWNLVTNEIWWNQGVEHLLHYSPATTKLDVEWWYQCLHPEDRQRVIEGVQNAIDTGKQFWAVEYRFLRSDGIYLHIYDRSYLMRDDTGKPVRMLGGMTDVSDLKRTELALRESEARLKLGMEIARMGWWDWDITSDRCFYSEQARVVFGLPPGNYHASYRDFIDCVHPEDREGAIAAIHQAVEAGMSYNIEFRTIWPDGTQHWINTKTKVYCDEQGKAVQIVGLSMDITERKHIEETIRYQANYDQLTGLPNRKQFSERLLAALEKAERDRSRLAVLFLDLDRFKNINDTLGHAAGDRLLQSMSERVKNCLRSTDMMARWGGDEFTILIPEIHSAEDPAKISQRILDSLKYAFNLEGHQLHISNSIGIAIYPQDGMDAETLLRNADAALYIAKEQGRNNYQFYTSVINSQAAEFLSLENELHQALKRQEFVLLYQPQINIVTGEVIGMEALIRWQHPQFGLVSPDKFIPLAEQTGLIIPIGEWVLQTACQQNKAWQDAGLPGVRVGVNLSARQFQQPNLIEMVANILSETGLSPEYLDLEITESLSMKNVDLTQKILTDLYNRGLHLSIDDFGTGYSSLRYLKQFPCHTLKIDRSFVQGLSNDSKDASIIKVIIALGRELNLELVAEGVETEEQKNLLHQMQCQYMQGYLFSRPLNRREATQFQERLFRVAS
ncbi:EAL domain-containing protein [Desertifilum sp. FACHB-1129]|nr:MULTISPECIES: EAL domain-containing protein [Desertifilum]MBD2310817.1 EAL domain-containing protein [Desertifilum sp. FACHB-1129]MBD2320854.1 EAL domain-containing protein [Desertifilum sp. FACHB-866]MBD2330982.1 EAL domain-containing protein [Desertifilum sp. FACHB-868]MDA0209692.1 EAL domain-containing protein [Cyanobacteria bacterium FC1]